MIKSRYTYMFAMVGLLAIASSCQVGMAEESEAAVQEQDVIVLTKKEAEDIVNVLEEITSRYISLKSGERASLSPACTVGTACGTAGVCGFSDDLLLQQILACIASVKRELDFICENLSDCSCTEALFESLADLIATATAEIIFTQTTCCAMLSSQISSVETSIIDTILDVEIDIINEVETCCASLTAEINNSELSLISAINTATTTIINTQTACCASLATQINNVQTSLVSVINTATTTIINNNTDCCETTTSLIDRIELILRGLLC